MRKHLVIPDTQVTPTSPKDHLSWIGQYIVEKKPDVIVDLGDFADMESLSSYDKGKLRAEGKRYKKDIEAAKEGMELLLRPLKNYNSKMEGQKHKLYKPEMRLVLGNHECYDTATEILTESGWKLFSELQVGELVYTIRKNQSGEWQPVKEIICNDYNGEMLIHHSRTVSMCVTPNHRVIWTNNEGTKMHEGMAKDCPSACDQFVSAPSGNGVSLSLEQIRFSAVALTDSHHGLSRRLTFYQSGEKANHIRNIILEAGVDFDEKERDRNITHICGKKLKARAKVAFEFYMTRPNWCPDNNKLMPPWAFNLNQKQFEVFLETLIFCDGSIPTRATDSRVFYGRKEICESLQALCITKGYRATISEYRPTHFRVNITKATKCRVEKFLKKRIHYTGKVWCAVVDNETLMIRRDNKPIFSGNCRITRAVESDPSLEGFMSIKDLGYEDFGWKVHPFLEIVTIDGVSYSHYFCNPLSGRPYSGYSIDTRLKNLSFTFVQGHQQTYLVGSRFLNTGKTIRGLVASSCYLHDEEYRGPQANGEMRAIFLLHEVHDGDYMLSEVSLDFLCRKYQGIPLWQFMKEKYPDIFNQSTWMKRRELVEAQG